MWLANQSLNQSVILRTSVADKYYDKKLISFIIFKTDQN